jgi:hypothetical protein
MSEKIIINPDEIVSLGDEGADNFYLVTNSPYVDNFELSLSEKYKNTEILICDEDDNFIEKILGQIPNNSCILTIMPDCLVKSVSPEVLGKRKLLIMACRSGKTDLEGIRHFIDCTANFDIHKQERMADNFFEKGEKSNYLELTNRMTSSSCRFDHLDEIYEWHEQYGFVDWNEQQVFPSGEIACFLVPLYIDKLSDDTRFDLNGEIVIQGPVIVQSGPPSFQLKDQLNIHQALTTDINSGVRLTIKNGEIISHSALDEAGHRAADILSDLFTVDSRYRRIYEVGFSLNESVKVWPGNTAMNEIWGGEGGRVHLGLGMLPHTQYHIDVFCSRTQVKTDQGEVILGPKEAMMKRKKSSHCPCIDV